MVTLYTWAKVLHIAAAMTFSGGTLTVSLFIRTLTAGAPLTSEIRHLARTVTHWDRAIVVPAMILTWALGLTLAQVGGWFHSAWLPVKLLFVIAISALHGIQSGILRGMTVRGVASRPSPFAASTILVSLIVIGFLAVAKPFS